MTEKWAVISEAAKYEISNLGNVRNAKTGHLLKLGLGGVSTPTVVLREGGKNICRSVPKLVRAAFGDKA